MLRVGVGVMKLVMVVVLVVGVVLMFVGRTLIVVKYGRELELNVLGASELWWTILVILVCQNSDLRREDQWFGWQSGHSSREDRFLV
jgi:hypothetical protein